jgi:DNA-binding IclR family transcriptional regulator
MSDKTIAALAADVRLIPSARLAAIVLAMHGGWLTRIDIANRCGVHDRTISRIFARLIELGMVVADWPEGSQVRIYRWKGSSE